MLRRFSRRKKDDGSNRSLSEIEKRNKSLLKKFLDFITSAIWSIPIASFIESQSVVFDRQQMVTEVYYEIHKEFNVLIDTLIECFCEDVQSSPEELVGAIAGFNAEGIDDKYKVALEPLLAAQNFNVFVPMMMRKNMELQLQALQMIEFMCGLIPSVLQLEDGESLRNMKNLTPEETERYVLISVLRHSKDEYESEKKSHDELQQVARNSRMQREMLEENIRREDLLLMKASIEYVQTVSEQRKNQGSSTQANEPVSVAAAMASHFTVDTGIGPDDITLESLERKPLNESLATGTMTSPEARPKSAKRSGSAARKSSKSDASIATTEIETTETGTSPDDMKEMEKESVTENNRKLSIAGLEDVIGVKTSESTEHVVSSIPFDADVLVTKEPIIKNSRDGSRPSTIKTTRGGSSDTGSTSRPSSRKGTSSHEPRAKTPSAKNEERPSTRRSSVDKQAPKRNDSIPRDRKPSVNTKSEIKKPPKPVGPLKSSKYEGNVILGRPESPGMEHGPRRKNLNDVNSHLVDPSRVNSSDVRTRAQYLREQRDKLLQMKNEERIKQMNEIQKSSVARPRTAQAAREVLEKKETDQLRKDITAKLKAEILTLH